MPRILNKRYMGKIHQTIDGMYHVSCGGKSVMTRDPEEAERILAELQREWVEGPAPLPEPPLQTEGERWMTVGDLRHLLSRYPSDHKAVMLKVANRYGNCPNCEEYDMAADDVGILNLPGWRDHHVAV